jgi:hypothetical protein
VDAGIGAGGHPGPAVPVAVTTLRE